MASASPQASEAAQIAVMLLRSKKTKNILYMEAGKDFVDLLLSFLTLPTGTVLKLLSQSYAIGSICNIFDSVKQLGENTFYVDKNVLLDQKPACSAVSATMNNVLAIEPGKQGFTTKGYKYYRCSCLPPRGLMRSHGESDRECRSCGHTCSKETQAWFFDNDVVAAAHVAEAKRKFTKPGFVKKSLTYCITDDLHIRPASTITSIAMLSNLRVEAMSDLESFSTMVGPKEALQLLRSSLCSNTTLNDVFGPTKSSGNYYRKT